MAIRTEEFHVKFSADNVQYRKAMTDGKKASEGFVESENKVKRALADTTQSLGAATSGADVANIAIGKLGEAFKTTLGVGAGVVIGSKLQEMLKAGAAEMERISGIARGVFSQGFSTAGKSVEDLVKELEDAKKASEEVAKSAADKSIGALATRYARVVLGNSTKEQDADTQDTINKLNQVALDRQKQISEVEAKKLGIIRAQISGQDDLAERMTKQLARENEIAKAWFTGGRAYVDTLKERYALEDALEKKRQNDVDDAFRLQSRILNVQLAGYNVEVKTAELQRDAARKKYSENQDPSKMQGLSAAYQGAQAAYDAAVRRQKVEKETLELQRQALVDQANGDQEHRQTLKMEAEILRQRLARAKMDDRPGLINQIEENRQKRELADKSARGRSLDIVAADIGNFKGMGRAEDIKAAEGMLLVLQARLKLEQSIGKAGEQQSYLLTSQLIGAAKQLEYMKAEKAVADAMNKAAWEQVFIEGSASSENRKRYQITQAQVAAVDAEIAAMQKLNPELAEAARLRKQGLQNDLQRQDEDLNMGKSGKEVRKRFRAEDKQERQRQNFRDRREQDGGLMDVHKDINGNVIGGTNPITGEHVDVPQKSGLDEKLPDMKMDGEGIADRIKRETDNFRKRFQKQEDAPAVPEKAEQKKPETDGDKIVNKLDDVKQAIEKAIAQ